MRLLLSCLHDVNSAIDKDHLILTVNTETKEIKWLELNIPEFNDLVASEALAYSGDYLLASIKTNSSKDKLLVIDVVTERHNISSYSKSSGVRSIHSVFRGKFYVCSSATNAMNQVSISPATTNIIRDVKHYIFDKDIHFNCFVNWQNRWYASFYGEGWRDGDFENGAIIELSSNNRKIYSNINQPNSLFFNRNDELCFCESGRGLFHYGRNIIHIGGYPRGVIEDPYENGYWIALSAEKKDIPKFPARLIFINHQGLMDGEIVIPHTYDIYSIVEARGYLSKLL